ncbi:hypothetical protein H106_02613 [Trichophyton rubrum CBS 735.88]|nr:hypothetical protein H106_02613 [Trichophyton rubrum CBS 735.88]
MRTDLLILPSLYSNESEYNGHQSPSLNHPNTHEYPLRQGSKRRMFRGEKHGQLYSTSKSSMLSVPVSYKSFHFPRPICPAIFTIHKCPNEPGHSTAAQDRRCQDSGTKCRPTCLEFLSGSLALSPG